jgi:hypothetical protein
MSGGGFIKFNINDNLDPDIDYYIKKENNYELIGKCRSKCDSETKGNIFFAIDNQSTNNFDLRNTKIFYVE